MQCAYILPHRRCLILSDIITQALYGVEVTQLETQIATVDKTNKYIINLFLTRKAPKLSDKTVDQYIRLKNSLKNNPKGTIL